MKFLPQSPVLLLLATLSLLLVSKSACYDETVIELFSRDCSGHGVRVDSLCQCYPGYEGEHCQVNLEEKEAAAAREREVEEGQGDLEDQNTTASVNLTVPAIADSPRSFLNKNKQPPSDDGFVFTDENLTKLSQLFTNEQLERIRASHLAGMSPNEISRLTATDASRFPVTELQGLTPDQVRAFQCDFINALSEEKFNVFWGHKFEWLSVNQITHLSTERWQTLDCEEQISQLGDLQIEALLPAQFAYLVSNKLKCLSQKQVAAFTPEQVSMLSPNLIASLTPLQIMGLGEAQIHVLSKAQIRALTQSQVQALSPDQVDWLTNKQITFLSAEQQDGFTQPQISRLAAKNKFGLIKNALAILERNFQQVSAELLNELGCKDLEHITPQHFMFVNLTEITKLNPMVLNCLNQEILLRLTHDQFRSLTSVQLNGLDESKLADLLNRFYASLSQEQVQGLSPPKICFVDLKALTLEQVQWVTPSQLSYLMLNQCK